MHEYSIVSALIDQVEHQLANHPHAKARRISVRIGELAGVEIGLLRTAYETIQDRTACAGAELAIEAVPAAWQCVACARPIATGAILRCPDCGRPARLASGGEIILERIEMEVPDV